MTALEANISADLLLYGTCTLRIAYKNKIVSITRVSPEKIRKVLPRKAK